MIITRRELEKIRNEYPVGCRVLMESMGHECRPIEKGETGTVQCVDDLGTIHVRWDSGRQLGIFIDVDVFHRIPD